MSSLSLWPQCLNSNEDITCKSFIFKAELCDENHIQNTALDVDIPLN